VANADQEVKILDIDGILSIEGRDLTLGNASTATTSTLDGTMVFKKVGTSRWRLFVLNTVTMNGSSSGLLKATKADGEEYESWINCSGVNHGKLVLTSQLLLKGTFTILASLQLDGTARVNHADDVMTIGEGVWVCGTYYPKVSGDGVFDVSAGLLEFKSVDLDDPSGAPNWDLSGGTIHLADTAYDDCLCSGVKVRIDMTGGTLDVDVDFSSTRDMTWSGGTIRVGQGATFEVQ